MKKYIVIIGILVAVGSLCSFGFLIHEIKLRKIAENNLEVELSHDYATQLELTKQEFKKYFDSTQTVLKDLGVKPRQVEHVIISKYNYIDTIIAKDTLIYYYDTIVNDSVAPFEFNNTCYDINGYVTRSNAFINEFKYHDNLTVALYKMKFRPFKRRQHRAIIYSECMNDTIQIVNNIKIIKKCSLKKNE